MLKNRISSSLMITQTNTTMKFFPAILLICFFHQALSQNVSKIKIDSLVERLEIETVDSTKAGLYYTIATRYSNQDPIQSLKYLRMGIVFCEKSGEKKYLPKLYLTLGKIYNTTGRDDSAEYAFTKSLQVAEAMGNMEVQASALRGAGYIYIMRSNYAKASELLFKSLKIAQATKNDGLTASVYGNISTLYLHQSNFNKAIEYGEKGLAHFKKIDSPQQSGTLYMNVGLIYAENKNYDRAEAYYKNAVAEFKKIDYKIGLATVYGNLSNIMKNERVKQIEYLTDAQIIWDEIAPDHPNAIGNIGNLGVAYLSLAIDLDNANMVKPQRSISLSKSQLLQKAESYLTKAVTLCKGIEFGRDLIFFTEQLAVLEEMKGNYKQSNQYLKDFIQLNDSLYSQDSKNKIAEAEGKHQLEMKNTELAIKDLRISNQNKQRLFYLVGLCLLSVIALLIFIQSRSRKTHNTTLLKLNTELEEANKVKAKFFAILSHDLRSPLARLINFLHLQKEAPDLLSGQQAVIHQQKIVTSAETLLENMETVLLWGKGQMVNFKPAKKKIVVGNLFKQLDDAFKGYEKVQLSFSDSENLEITNDENYLFTIMQNLTANALKALDGTASGLIQWKAEKQNDGKVTLSIADNGQGLSEDKREKLLNGQEITANKNGFGFHIVRDLAKAIDCNIEVESKPDKGTTFRLHC